MMLIVDLSGSGLFGSVEKTKRELMAEIASVLAFSAIRNNDKVGLILFTDEVELFIPPRKGKRHVLRVIREILFFQPRHLGTDLNKALEFLVKVISRRAIAIVISDFLGQTHPTKSDITTHLRHRVIMSETLAQTSVLALSRANRRHDVIAVQVQDPYELELPNLGLIVLKDAETGEVVEINTGDQRKRRAFTERQLKVQAELEKIFKAARIDVIKLRTDRSYISELTKFFETREKRRRRG
jgi:uncharacterized protein (DUF58 family)